MNQCFPVELLTQSIDERLAYFDRIIVAHPRLVEVQNALIQRLESPNRPLVIGVVGPTGVGKSAMRTMIEKYILQGSLRELERNPGCIPVAGMLAIAPEYGAFQWEDYYRRALMTLDEPLIDAKIDDPGQNSQSVQLGRPSVRAAALRWALEQCLRYRQTTTFMLDEGQHLTRVTKSIQLIAQAYTIYSLAEATGTTHVLFGTYEMLPLMRCLSELGRHNILLHFPPYHLNRTGDRQEFERLLFTFQCHLPLADVPDLTGNIVDLYRRSLGCVGVLKQWLSSALKNALEAGRPTLTLTDLNHYALEKPKVLQMARELQVGEAAFHGAEGRSDVLDGFPKNAGHSEGSKVNTSPQSQRRRVGERKPKRDKVGR